MLVATSSLLVISIINNVSSNEVFDKKYQQNNIIQKFSQLFYALLDENATDYNNVLTVYTNTFTLRSVAASVLRALHQRSYFSVQLVHHWGPKKDELSKGNSYLLFLPECSAQFLHQHINKLRYRNGWNPGGRFLLLITTPVNTCEPSMFQALKTYNILNVVVGTFTSTTGQEEHIKLFTYNPFGRGGSVIVHDATNDDINTLFSRKPLNVQGNAVKITEYSARNTKSDLMKRGVFSAFLSRINAVEKAVVHKERNEYAAVTKGLVDVTLIAYQTHFNFYFESTYPHSFDGIVFLVPTAERISQYQNLFLPFDLITWCTMFCSIPVFAIFWFLIQRLNKTAGSFPSNLFYSFSIFISVPLETVPLIVSERVLILFWIYVSLVIQNAFQGSLTSILSATKYHPEMNTYKDLYESGLPVVSPDSYEPMIIPTLEITFPKLIGRLTTEVKGKGWEQCFRDITSYRNVSVAITEIWGADQVTRDQNARRGKPLIHIMKEKIPGITFGFATSGFSPYNIPFSETVQRTIEVGLLNEWSRSAFEIKKRWIPSEEPQQFTLDHLQTAFYILFIGYVISVVGFMLETVIPRRSI